MKLQKRDKGRNTFKAGEREELQMKEKGACRNQKKLTKVKILQRRKTWEHRGNIN